MFPLVRELADDGSDVAVTCRVLNLRRQGYYEWRSGVKSARILENEMLLKHIEKIHEGSRGTYGWPRVHAELRLGLGMTVNHKRVARLMREAGIQGLYRRRRHGCTVRDLHAEPHADLVDRDFVVDGPDELWCTDITEHPTLEEKVYRAAVLDAYSRRIVGWSTTTTCAPPWWSTLSAWPSPVASLTGMRRYCTLITVLNLRPGRSGSG